MKWLPFAAGMVLITIGSLSLALGFGGLAYVRVDLGAEVLTTAPDLHWAVWVLCFALGSVLVADPDPVEGRVDEGQLVGAIWMFLVMGAAFLFFAQDLNMAPTPHEPCRYRGCWPLGFQQVAVAAPALVMCALMVVMSWRPKNSWVARALGPAATLVVLAVIQLVLWDWLIRPWLFGPPPF